MHPNKLLIMRGVLTSGNRYSNNNTLSADLEFCSENCRINNSALYLTVVIKDSDELFTMDVPGLLNGTNEHSMVG